MTGKGLSARQDLRRSASSGIVPSSTPPTHTESQSGKASCPALANTQGFAPYKLTGVLIQEAKVAPPGTQTQDGCQNEETKKYAQMKDQNTTPEKELSDVEIANLSDTKFKTLVVRMLIDLIAYSKGIREEMKAILREIKKNPQDTSSDGKEAKIQTNDLQHKEEINIQPEQNEEIRIQKNEESLRNLWDNF